MKFRAESCNHLTLLVTKRGDVSFSVALLSRSPGLVFFYWGSWHGVGFNDSWDGAYLVLHEVHGVVVVVGFKPYAGVPCSENVVGVVQCYACRRILGEILQVAHEVAGVFWMYLYKKQIVWQNSSPSLRCFFSASCLTCMDLYIVKQKFRFKIM